MAWVRPRILLAHLHGAADAVGLLLDPLHILTLAEHQPAGGAFDGLGTAVDDEIRTLAVIEAQILFRRRIDDEREPVGPGHLGRLGHRQNALLHAVVGLDVEDGGGIGVDGGGQLGGEHSLA